MRAHHCVDTGGDGRAGLFLRELLGHEVLDDLDLVALLRGELQVPQLRLRAHRSCAEITVIELEVVDPQVLEGARRGLLEAGLVTHAQLEDELLFDGLQPGLDQMGKLEKVLQDHDGICQRLASIRTCRSRVEAQRRLLEVVDITRGELDLEDRVLFKIAEETMHRDTLEKLGRAWARKRMVPLP